VVPPIGEDVTTIRSRADITSHRASHPERLLGGAALVVGVQGLKPSGLLVLVHRLTVQVGSLPVQLAQARVGRAGHQILAALGGRPLAGDLLTRPIAELLGAPSALTMLLEICGGHNPTVLPRPLPPDIGPQALHAPVAWRDGASPELRQLRSQHHRSRQSAACARFTPRPRWSD
jgi:hypothetical protein